MNTINSAKYNLTRSYMGFAQKSERPKKFGKL
jgi:hypothetical protein